MGTKALEIVRFRGRYYMTYHQQDGYFEGIGAAIVAGIPSDPDEYQKWLKRIRGDYAAKESVLEKEVYEIRDNVKPDPWLFDEFVDLPSELPRKFDFCEFMYCYIINLDREILTIDFSMHWKLWNIPRQDGLWLRAIKDSIYEHALMISLDVCPEEHMASPALDLPEPNWRMEHNHRVVAPRTSIIEPRKAFLTHILSHTMVHYADAIVRAGGGGECSPDSSPFRELIFALVSIASGQADFHSLPADGLHPQTCNSLFKCVPNHLQDSPRWLDGTWSGKNYPLLPFGSPCHRPGEPPGASPAETIYWFEGVLVKLALVVDAKAISEAVAWGTEHGRANFQIVVLSLFEVAFAEVTSDDAGKLFVRYSRAIDLSPVCAEDCLSTHPRERPALKPGMDSLMRPGLDWIMDINRRDLTAGILLGRFPGLAALVDFFEVAANCCAVSKSGGILPQELYDRILEFVDYDTWKNCLLVSTGFRSHCLRRYRIDDQKRIVAGPFVRLKQSGSRMRRLMSLDFENMETGEVSLMMIPPQPYARNLQAYNWAPLIGRDRKVLMVDTVFQFEPAADASLEPDSPDNNECI
ncbi:hypothetical protein N7492_007059 [Penicillium capsulatum]|uniref:F-box domain-containing protein n=1 Tax=Penicillium capsulatum TaxID=69766 RepID=A0A9W9I1Y3_9EURO|nr:hypothetical protein N7492_007059 [Penicillium capsulatum]